MHQCGQFANTVVKLKHHLSHMIISYAIDDMSPTHTDDFHVSWVFLCLQFRFILAYFIGGLACMAVLRIIAFNRGIIGARWIDISGWTIGPRGRDTNCISWGYLFATNAVYRCVLYCGMDRCGQFASAVVKIKHHLWHMIISYDIHDMPATHTDDLHVSWIFLCLQFLFIDVYFTVVFLCMAVLRIIAFNGGIIGDRWLVISGWIISPGGTNTTCICWDIHSPWTSFYRCVFYCGMRRCGEFLNNFVKLKHHSWQMIVS